ncbi:CIC11C00000001093 [Sungouiella intermedia]|uniref:CIC11C00000001093 n=1 Tax=Sungouiella intermedia TaxID=45354 RepID=A0A1L0BLZ3_9ASCO|nr:CIC11C00000001093 [[Candida] intermedia]
MSLEIPKISLHDFANRREQIKQELYNAAVSVGFFVLCNQQSPSVQEIENAFAMSKQYFDKPTDVKEKLPFKKLFNCGYEFKAQVRPSTGTRDLKETMQLQMHRKNSYWPSATDVGEEWRENATEFMEKCQKLSMDVLSCLAEVLGFDEHFFVKAHQIHQDDAQSTLRLLHYPDVTGEVYADNEWRAGAHTDFDCLTLLFQRTGDHGLEVCPGRDAHTDFAIGDTWYPVEAKTGEIVVNIGDMLMSWSDDKFKSNFHRVRTPKIGENQTSRYTIAWFNQANENIVIQGPDKKYPAITGKEYIVEAMRKNFARLLETKA